jgi:hypothetical protein
MIMRKSILTPKKVREKGISVPSISINEAIGYTRKVYDIVGESAMPFSEAMKIMGVSTDYGKVFIKVFKDYGLMAQNKNGFWLITSLGIKCLIGEYDAIRQAFVKVPVFDQLMSTFGDGKYTPEAIKVYLKNQYHKSDNYVKVASERFWAGKAYLESIKGGEHAPSELEVSMDASGIRKTLKIIQLSYALNPPSKNEIDDLVGDVYNELKDDENPAIRTLSESMKNNKNNPQNLELLFENIKKILSEKYPAIASKEKKLMKNQNINAANGD